MTDRQSPSNVESLPPEPGRRVLIKGQQTKAAIIDGALGLASQIRLEGLSIGAVAEATVLSSLAIGEVSTNSKTTHVQLFGQILPDLELIRATT